jgi:hypothetical protein
VCVYVFFEIIYSRFFVSFIVCLRLSDIVREIQQTSVE